MKMTIPFEFIDKRVSLTWNEALWGYEHQLLGWSSLVDLAVDKLCSGSNDPIEIELAGIRKNEAWLVGDLVRKLAAAGAPSPENLIRRKWLFLVLDWLFENRSQLEDALGEVEVVYADFDYPKEIAGFVRFMPPADGYDARQHSKAENEQRLFDLWHKYLTVADREFGVSAQ